MCCDVMYHIYFPFYFDSRSPFFVLCLPITSPAPTGELYHFTIKRSKVNGHVKQITTDHQNERKTGNFDSDTDSTFMFDVYC